ncbi:hypothetical protein MYX07_00235 [Patescibacteria group bacterium AH-259-L07]|nr:hypothetical protein [Patescibacteria group bacterium AH-259-L07]
MKDTNIKNEAWKYVVITDSTTDQRLLKKGRIGVYAYTLYHFYATQSAIQQTNKVWITDSFCRKGLHWGRNKFEQAKKILIKEKIIEEIQRKDEKGHFTKKYIIIHFLYNPDRLTPNPQAVKPASGKETTNALDKKTNALDKKINASKEKIINYTLKDRELTDLLYSLVQKNYSWVKQKTEKALEKNCEEMNRLNRIDGWDYKQIEFVIRWSQKDDFWRQNIRSVSKLRKQFENLIIRIKEKSNKNKIAII